MKAFQAADLARRTGDLLEAASREPVTITKHRKPRFVIMSIDRFEALTGRPPEPGAYALDELPEELGAALDAGLARDLGDG